ncbi:MAG: bifunctional adenosylcobinamide kinase/adenosylcobinamide-phosphate guanylyltransferase [Lachnospiraceae bacterium]|nr:bifunctional adenosylcobinamide kinase/adenosylcobinamide-phosphate guanylyltransferase [Lachnospiraceae bacterium]
MLTVVTGGSGSGKSEFAEQLIMRQTGGGQIYYIATMQPFGSEGARRIARHRKQRAGMGFITLEQYARIENADVPKGAGALLECMSNLAANEMFDGRRGRSATEIRDDIIRGVEALYARCDKLVIVTNEIFSDGNSYDRKTREYIQCMGEINRSLAKMADCVVEVVYSIPVYIKNGELYECD